MDFEQLKFLNGTCFKTSKLSLKQNCLENGYLRDLEFEGDVKNRKYGLDLEYLRPEDFEDLENFEPKKDLGDLGLDGDFGGEIRTRFTSGDKSWVLRLWDRSLLCAFVLCSS